MLLRKINAVISLITTILLLDHAIFNAVLMISRGTVVISGYFMPWLLAVFMFVHAVISISLAVSSHAETKKSKFKSYPKLNAATIAQRISGILLIVFTSLHIAGASGFMHTPKAVHAIVTPLFFIIALMHAAVSTSKALITLGIGTAKFIRVADIIIKVICALTMIVALIGFYLYHV